ncbi:MAG: glycerol-3-phosphate acyltransferase, partial [Deltaproteobacteria bacterium]
MENFVMDFTPWAIVAGGYLVGSIVPGVLFVRLARGEDIRRLGSGNVGATNVGRVLGLPFALLTFAWDAFKGFGVCWFAQRLVLPPSFVVAGGLAAFLGHLYPCFFGFRGGKGVATAFGVVLALDPRVATISLGVWIVTLLFWKRA